MGGLWAAAAWLLAASATGIPVDVSPTAVRSGETVAVTLNGAEIPQDAWLAIWQGSQPLAWMASLPSQNGTVVQVRVRVYNMRLGNYTMRVMRPGGSVYSPPLAVSRPVSFFSEATEPTFVHLSLDGAPGAIAVQWVSGSDATPCVRVVAQDSTSATPCGQHDTYTIQDMCERPEAQPGAWISPGYLHTVRVAGLQPGAPYTYYLGYSAGDFDTTPRQLTAPRGPGAAAGPTSFVMYADMGPERPFCDGCSIYAPMPFAPGARDLIGRIIDVETKVQPPAFVLHAGDLSYARNHALQWDIWGHTIQPLAQRVPYMVSVGNHEYDHLSGGLGKDPSDPSSDAGWHPAFGNMGDDSNGECGVPTAKRFRAPGTTPASPHGASGGNGVFWYSFEEGLVHTTVISSEHDVGEGSRQRRWIESDLGGVNRSRTPWVVLATHRPLYTSEEDKADHITSEGIRRLLEPALLRHGVDLVLSGHFHSYERTAPVRNGTVVGSEDDARAPVHICVGTAGIGFDSPDWYQEPWSRKRYPHVFGYARVDAVNATALHWRFVGTGNGTATHLDEVWIRSAHAWGR